MTAGPAPDASDATAGARRPWRWRAWTAPLLVIALLARLVPVLHGGGLFGYGDYDDGVYFTAAVGLVDGRVPYRDFLLLHPPGVLLVLAPFAALTTIFPDPVALAAARVAWMLLGVVNCALVTRILWPLGRFAAVLGGLSYAVFFPAVYSDHTTLLEAPANTVLLLALLMLRRAERTAPTDRIAPWFAVGALIGLSPTFKIWGVVPAAVIIGYLGLRHGRRALVGGLAGTAATLLAVLGPFAALAPTAMWRLVVADQLRRTAHAGRLALRLQGITGLRDYPLHGPGAVLVAAATLGWVVLVGSAAIRPGGRLFALLHVGMTALLLATPVWFSHYAGFVGATAALVAGAGGVTLLRSLADRRRLPGRLRAALGPVALAVVVIMAVPLAWASFGTPYPLATLAPSASAATGCVSTDDPVNLIELDLLTRNLDRGCPLVVDLGGYNYDLQGAGRTLPRKRNPRWQAAAIGYLRSGSRVVLSRFSSPATTPFDPATQRVITAWHVLARSGHLVVRRPRTLAP